MHAPDPEAPHRPKRSHAQILLLLSLLAALIAAVPLLAEPGLLNTRGGGDSPFLLQRLHQLETAVRDGHFPVRWMPDANYGYGYPFYNFYAPLSIYITTGMRMLGLSYVRAIQAAQLLGFVVAAWGMFALGRRWMGGAWGGLVTAVAYTAAPFHLVNVYVRGDSLAEFWAMAFYPLVILAVDGLFGAQGQQRTSRVALLALAYAALILSHNISALIFSPFLLLYVGLRWLGVAQASGDTQSAAGAGRYLGAAALALLLAFGLSAWFFVPALVEQDLAQLGPVTEGYFHYSNHFRSADLVQPSPIFDYSVAGGKAFRMGLAQAIAAAAGLVVLLFNLRSPGRRAWLMPRVFVVLGLLIATFMITSLSRFLWDNLPLLPFTQFPWRFLSVQAFFTALAAGALALLPGRRVLAPLLAVLLLVAGLAGLRTDHLILTDADVTPQRLAEYEWFTGNIGSTVSAEYLPPTVVPRAYTSLWLNDGQRAQARALAGELVDAVLTERRAVRQTWQVETAVSGAAIMFPTLYWPGWQAAIDGAPVELRPAPGSGLILLDVPPGAHTVTLKLARTPVRLVAELASLAALLLAIWLLRPWRWRPARGHVAALAAVIVVALVGWLWPARPLPNDNLTWDFAQMGYLHHDVEGVAFEDGLVLERYAYAAETAVPGETLTITLQLRGATGQTGTLALASPAVTWPAFEPPAPVITSQTLPLAGDAVTFELSIPQNAPVGLMVPRFTVDGPRPLMPSGQMRGDLFLRPVRIAGRQPADGAGLDARATVATLRADGALDMALAWFTGQPLSHNYNFSLRLLDARGGLLAQLDGQPGYGFQPSSGWQPGAWQPDRLALPLPQPLPAPQPHALVVRLYEVATGDVVLTRRLGELAAADGAVTFTPHAPQFEVPSSITPFAANFGDAITLRGYELAQVDGTLRLALVWQALANGQTDYTRFVHLVDVDSGEIVAQRDGYPRGGSYPTSQWVADEVVVDEVVLDVGALSAGEYALLVGFYRPEDGAYPRLTAVAPDGTPFPDDRVPLPGPIILQ